jgi:hypothetical protein
MSVGADRCGIDQHPTNLLELGIGGHALKQPMHGSRVDPSPQPLVHSHPVPELAGQIAERNAGAAEIQ